MYSEFSGEIIMGQLIVPKNHNYKGPFLIDKKALEELNESLNIVEELLNNAYNIELKKVVDAHFEKYKKFDDKYTLTKAKKEVSESYPFANSKTEVWLTSKQKKSITDSSLLNLLQDPQISELYPKNIIVNIEKGPCTFSLELSTKYEGDIETKIDGVKDDIVNEVTYEISKWIDKYKPNFATKIWSNYFPYVFAPLVLIIFFMVMFIYQNDKDLYQTQLLNESQELLIDGINQDEINKAVEIIIQKEVGYVPPDFSPTREINSTVLWSGLIALIIILILSIKPISTIGLGKNTWKVKFYKKWIYFVLVFIPLSIIFPLVGSKIM